MWNCVFQQKLLVFQSPGTIGAALVGLDSGADAAPPLFAVLRVVLAGDVVAPDRGT